jgi:hypothetical protein
MATNREQIESLLDRAADGDDVADADVKLLTDFRGRLDLHDQTYSTVRKKKLVGTAVRTAERQDTRLFDALYDRSAAESIVGWINRTWDNEETNRDYRSVLRVFGKRVAELPRFDDLETDSNDIPEALAWVPTGTSSDYDPTPDPREMLRWDEDVIPMIDNTYNSRDAAMIAVGFDAGLRGGEFKALTIGDVQDHKHGLQVTAEGKQGRRSVTLIPAAPYLNDWLDDHPADRTDADAPLWSELYEVDDISDRMVGQALKEAADRGDVTRPVTLTNFRKSSAAYLASRNLNQAHIEDHHGWVTGSRAASRYISVFGADTDRELAKIHGIDIDPDDEAAEIAPVDCPRCRQAVPRHEPTCPNCGQAMTPAAAEELAAARSESNAEQADVDSADAAAIINQVMAAAEENPDAVERLLGQH